MHCLIYRLSPAWIVCLASWAVIGLLIGRMA